MADEQVAGARTASSVRTALVSAAVGALIGFGGSYLISQQQIDAADRRTRVEIRIDAYADFLSSVNGWYRALGAGANTAWAMGDVPTADQRAQIQAMLDKRDSTQDTRLTDASYRLQVVASDPMKERGELLMSSLNALEDQLEAFANGSGPAGRFDTAANWARADAAYTDFRVSAREEVG